MLVEGDPVAAVGPLPDMAEAEELWADDCTVAPGSIDLHTHAAANTRTLTAL